MAHNENSVRSSLAVSCFKPTANRSGSFSHPLRVFVAYLLFRKKDDLTFYQGLSRTLADVLQEFETFHPTSDILERSPLPTERKMGLPVLFNA